MPNTPPASQVQLILKSVHDNLRDDTNGAVADYIPALAKADANGFGLAITTTDGVTHSVGDALKPFSIQSISKAFTYCLALEIAGRANVFTRVGVEPSGDAFNAIEFDPHTNRPYNPMVNAGAIAVAGILREARGDEAYGVMLERFSLAAGRPLSIDQEVFESESETGHRNRAIAHLLLSAGALRQPVDPVVELYFRQCAISVTAIDLAMMGATLANMGTNPLTGIQVFDIGAIRATISVMMSCGMYDYSGNWAYDVGIPAKSGVGGGILGCVNRQVGIGTYSPRLDMKGNSVRGMRAFRMLSDELGLHAFDPTNRGSSFTQSFFK